MATSTHTPSIHGFSELNEEQKAELGTKFPIAWEGPKPVQRDNVAIFIVPNGLVPVRELKNSASEFQSEKLAGIEDFYGIKLDDSDLLVQFWATDRSDRSGNSNLNDHGYCDEAGNLHRFPTYIPMSIISRKREGDILRIDGDQGSFTLQCLQKPYRYSRFGRFEEVMSDLLRRAK